MNNLGTWKSYLVATFLAATADSCRRLGSDNYREKRDTYQRGALRSSGTGSVRVQVRGPYGFRYGSVSVGSYGFVRV